MSIAWNPPRIAFPAYPSRKRTRPVTASPEQATEQAEASRHLAESKRNLEATRTECAEHLRISANLHRLMEDMR